MKAYAWLLALSGPLAFAITASAAHSSDSPPEHPLRKWTTTSCRAIDGDTLKCSKQSIRLLAIDTPELPGHCRKGRRCAPGDPYKAKAALAKLTHGRLTIEPIKNDRYGRTIAQVSTARTGDFSCAMLKAGATYKSKWDDGYRIFLTCPFTVLAS